MHSRPLPDPLMWHILELPFALPLLKTYIAEIEAQVGRSIAEFRLGEGTTTVYVDEHEGEHGGYAVDEYKGIHSGFWNLQSVFEDYLPNLQRRSALITLYSFLEHELDRLCDRIRIYEKSALYLTDITDKGIARATTYLIKIGGLTGVRNSEHWQEITNIQSIRNLIVHAGGRIPEVGNNRHAKLLAYIGKNPYLSVTQEVKIQPGYLAHCLETFTAFFGEIHAQLQRRYGV